jgi:hypothetical protein
MAVVAAVVFAAAAAAAVVMVIDGGGGDEVEDVDADDPTPIIRGGDAVVTETAGTCCEDDKLVDGVGKYLNLLMCNLTAALVARCG